MRFVAAVGVVGLVVGVAMFIRAATPWAAPATRRATPWSGPMATTRTTEELRRAADHRELELTEQHEEKPDIVVEDEPRAPRRIAPTQVAGDPRYSFAGILPRAQRVTLSFTAATGRGIPDSMGAVGPKQFLLVINQAIKSFDSVTGAPDHAIDISLPAFFSPVGTSPVDPNVRYDRQSDKWIVGAISYPGNTNGSNLMLFAVSDIGILTSTTHWTFFQFQFDQAAPAGDTGCSADYPFWGLDAVALYIRVGVISCRDGSTRNPTIFVIRKASLLGRGPIVVSTFRNIDISSAGSPVDNLDGGGGTGYFVKDRQLCRIANAPDSPELLPCVTIQNNEVFQYSLAVRHKGNDEESGSQVNNDASNDSSGRLHIGSGVAKTGILRGGHLWFAVSTGFDNTGTFYYGTEIRKGSRVGIIWWEIDDIDSNRPRVVDSSRLFHPSSNNDVNQRNYWMPSLMVSGQRHMLIGASSAGIEEYVNAVAAGRLAGDPPGTFRDPGIYTNSAFPYNDNVANTAGSTISPKGVRRWGDYSQTTIDPCDDMTMWTVQEYTADVDRWGVAVARVAAPPPATPANAAPSLIVGGQAAVDVQIEGTSSNGSGFFDPGSGFACRLRVTVPGASVVGVRVIDPKTLRVTLSTQGVTPGPLDFTVTNPDGQSTTGTALVRVQP